MRPAQPEPETTAAPHGVEATPHTGREVGWYRDPADARLHRYWDGDRWVGQDERPGRADGAGPPS